MRSFEEEPLASGGGAYEPRGPDVVFDRVGFSYEQGGERVLEDVSFTAREGEVTALVGPSGSGKSTCARLSCRLWDASSGCVTVGGVDVSGVDPEVLLGDFAVVFQDVLLFDDTVMGNIRLGRRGATDEEVLAAGGLCVIGTERHGPSWRPTRSWCSTAAAWPSREPPSSLWPKAASLPAWCACRPKAPSGPSRLASLSGFVRAG